jgi:ADP-ribose pyrophosphatase YjhB (NUDIX family)
MYNNEMIKCTFEDGGTGELRHATANAIIVKDGKILLNKRGQTYGGGKPLIEAGKWSLIGGFMKRDETIEQALRREVKEETGMEIGSLKLFHIKDNPDREHDADRQCIEFVFIAEAKTEYTGSDEEVEKVQWFGVDDLPAKETVAFDHYRDLMLYKKYLKESIPLPYFGKFEG